MKLTRKISVLLIISAIIISTFSFSAFATSTVIGKDVAEFATALEGCGYQYASKGPNKFDCSGLVYYVLKNHGIIFGNSTSEYNTIEKAASYGKVINDISEAQAGDIVVWSSHAGVYLGDGKCISAMNSRKGVVISEVEKFVDRHGVTNPSHFFIRPFDYAEEVAEEIVPETETEITEVPEIPAEETVKPTLADRFRLMFDRIEEFFKAPFKK